MTRSRSVLIYLVLATGWVLGQARSPLVAQEVSDSSLGLPHLTGLWCAETCADGNVFIAVDTGVVSLTAHLPADFQGAPHYAVATKLVIVASDARELIAIGGSGCGGWLVLASPSSDPTTPRGLAHDLAAKSSVQLVRTETGRELTFYPGCLRQPLTAMSRAVG